MILPHMIDTNEKIKWRKGQGHWVTGLGKNKRYVKKSIPRL